ncbi:MAG: hypothetical protein JTT11_04530, partial [Candidatus Brockarchaeota archaeon]|nr:hypothetical protein [Candidatus Brockarchaeota archaeon]
MGKMQELRARYGGRNMSFSGGSILFIWLAIIMRNPPLSVFSGDKLFSSSSLDESLFACFSAFAFI